MDNTNIIKALRSLGYANPSWYELLNRAASIIEDQEAEIEDLNRFVRDLESEYDGLNKSYQEIKLSCV